MIVGNLLLNTVEHHLQRRRGRRCLIDNLDVLGGKLLRQLGPRRSGRCGQLRPIRRAGREPPKVLRPVEPCRQTPACAVRFERLAGNHLRGGLPSFLAMKMQQDPCVQLYGGAHCATVRVDDQGFANFGKTCARFQAGNENGNIDGDSGTASKYGGGIRILHSHCLHARVSDDSALRGVASAASINLTPSAIPASVSGVLCPAAERPMRSSSLVTG